MFEIKTVDVIESRAFCACACGFYSGSGTGFSDIEDEEQ